jgi:hypothetical protein
MTHEDLEFRRQFSRLFPSSHGGAILFDRPTRAERDFRAAMAVLKRPAPVRKSSMPVAQRVAAVSAETHDIRRASDAIGAVLKQVQDDIAMLTAQRDAAAAAAESKNQTFN